MHLFTTISLLAIVRAAIANNCIPGLTYCQNTLLGIGKYQPQIDQAIFDANITDNGKALFYCVGGANGVISYITSCPLSCHDAGSDGGDFCDGL